MPGSERRPAVLILGGTAEAAALAGGLVARHGVALRVVSSLAGRTERPGHLAGEVRIGGFGGADGLRCYLEANDIDLLVDATHPFAATISANAAAAAERSGTPRLVLARPMWRRDPRDRWIEVPDVTAAAATTARIGRRAFLTVGPGDLGAFAALDSVWLLVRAISGRAVPPLAAPHEVLIARGPFAAPAEEALMRRYGIDLLVTKASGGAATEGKIVAARRLGLRVVMVRRPPPPPGPKVESVEAAVEWVGERLGTGSG